MAKKRKRSRYQGWLNRHIGDLRHMLRCCKAGRLPAGNIGYIEHILTDPHRLPKPREIAQRVQFTYEQQQTNHIYTVPAVDKTKEELAQLRKAKDAERKMRARRRAGIPTKAQRRKSERPAHIPQSTWYRRRAKERKAQSTKPPTEEMHWLVRPDHQVGISRPDHQSEKWESRVR